MKFILIAGFIFVLIFAAAAQEQPNKAEGYGVGNGRSEVTDEKRNPTETRQFTPKTNQGVRIISKPKADYTDKARRENVSGTILLRITFKANGQIGGVKVLKGLPAGLSQKAVEAAKKIRFEPAIKNGKPYSVTKKIEYTFTIY